MKYLKAFKKMLLQQNDGFIELSPSMNNSFIILGEPVILLLKNGDIVKTSPVENFYIDDYGRMEIDTKNTIYKN